MKIFQIKNNRGFIHRSTTEGFTLLETLVGLLIFSMSILATMAVLGAGIADTNYSKQKITAGYLAQEGIEHIRNIRDSYVLYNVGGGKAGWDQFRNDFTNQSYPVSNADIIGFDRTIGIKTSLSADEIEIFSTVTWEQGSGQKNITFSEHLFNWVE